MSKDLSLDTDLSIYSISGQLVKKGTIGQLTGKSLPSGQYLLHFQGKSQKIFIP
jgi:hypothetical protein